MAKKSEDGRRRGLTTEEQELWQRVTVGTKRLDKASPNSPTGLGTDEPESEAAGDTSVATPQPARKRPASPQADRPQSPPAREPDLSHGSAAGIDKRTLTRLRRGLIPVEGEIDLHGYTYENARRHLERYLDVSQAVGRRCILVITGKGLRVEGGRGVLRTSVPQWLNEPPCRDRVLAFAYASSAHGGMGALYVLLRRRRP
ncbi:MAG: Smr/MutS family protein [Rhodospirillales bacterium]|nr:Smr/MutS family protein [Rhodospirillales bacterium]